MIYIVEDDAAIRELEQYALQSSGYEVQSFETSEPFWQAMRAAEPELVILDVMLPGEDGFSILKNSLPNFETDTHSFLFFGKNICKKCNMLHRFSPHFPLLFSIIITQFFSTNRIFVTFATEFSLIFCYSFNKVTDKKPFYINS